QLQYLSTLLHQLDQLEVQTIQGLGNPNVEAMTNADAFAGHTWCTADPWAYGLTVLTDDNLDSKAPFHPTPTGQAVLASRMEPVVGQLFQPTTGPLVPLQPAQPNGYVVASANGGAFAYGGVPFNGSVPGAGAQVSDVVGVSPVPHGTGYRMVGADGGVFAFGNALYEGSLPAIGVAVDDVVGMAATPDGNGYWLVDKTGGVYGFGAAPFDGSLPGIGVHVDDVVGMVSTPDAKGYWLVGADGGVFAFGDAGFYGSVAGGPAHQPITGIARTADGQGYWLVGSDGGVYAFGHAPFSGSLPGVGVTVGDIRGVTRSPGGRGYWLVGADGGVFAFGDAPFDGSAVGTTGGQPVDGYLVHGCWQFSSGRNSVRMRHLRSRPAVTATHLPGEELAVTVHGRAELFDLMTPAGDDLRQAMVDHYLPTQGPAFEEWLRQENPVGARIVADRMFTFQLNPS